MFCSFNLINWSQIIGIRTGQVMSTKFLFDVQILKISSKKYQVLKLLMKTNAKCKNDQYQLLLIV
jgi:hypothetical protein